MQPLVYTWLECGFHSYWKLIQAHVLDFGILLPFKKWYMANPRFLFQLKVINKINFVGYFFMPTNKESVFWVRVENHAVTRHHPTS
jgi:hypothetical protein